MKQGRTPTTMSGAKREPVPKAKNIAKVADIGLQQVRTRDYKDLGRGFMAPAPVAKTVHKSGSQRKG